MKLWKKLLIGVLILGAIVVGLIGYGFFKIGKTYTQDIAPDMQRYVRMTQVEQDQYVLSRMGELTMKIYGEDKDGKGRAVVEAMNNDPALRQAGIGWGRSICASIIKDDKDIFDTLSAQDKRKYKEEADDLEDRGETFQAMLKNIK